MTLKHFVCVCSLVSVVCMPQLSLAGKVMGEVVEYIGGQGGVSWTRGRVMVDSTAAERGSRYKACRASTVVAQRDLVEIIGGVRVDSETLVQDNILSKDVIRATVQGRLRGGQVVGRQMNADGTCTISMEVALAGPLASGVYAYQGEGAQTGHRYVPGVHPFLSVLDWFVSPAYASQAPWKKDLDALQLRLDRLEHLLRTQPALASQVAASGEVTGLVVDARGNNFTPSMSPKLRRGKGAVLYPGRHPTARQEGRLVALFMNDLLVAQTHPRVGARPLVVKAARTWGKQRTEIVLGKAEAAQVETLVKEKILDFFPVVIVLD